VTEYVVLLPGDEATWATADQQRRTEIYAAHHAFAVELIERGHRITGGAQLTPYSAGSVVRRGADGSVEVTTGPGSAGAEQLTGLYLVQSDDLDDLLEVCALLVDVEVRVEVREAVPEVVPEVDADDGAAS
jgi:hypothetical protein